MAIVRISIALTWSLAFGHEVGHILGGLHNREFYEQYGYEQTHPYSYGYMLPNSARRTIMSYVQFDTHTLTAIYVGLIGTRYNSDGNHPDKQPYYSSSDNTDENNSSLGDNHNDNSR